MRDMREEWVCGEKIQKMKETMGNVSKHGLRFSTRCGHPCTPKRSENGHFSDALLLQFTSRFTDVFRHGVLFQTPKKTLFHQRSYSKGPNQALEKVLTNETPCIFQDIELRGVSMTHELGLGPNKTADVVLSVIVQHSWSWKVWNLRNTTVASERTDHNWDTVHKITHWNMWTFHQGEKSNKRLNNSSQDKARTKKCMQKLPNSEIIMIIVFEKCFVL